MRRQFTIALAALVAGGAFALFSGPLTRAEDKPGEAAPAAAAERQRVAFPAGVKLKDEPTKEDRGGILKPLAGITEAALTKNGLDDVVERLVDQDRNRIGKDGSTERTYDDLNARAESLRKAWKDKYGSDFDVDEEKAFAQVATIVGEVEDAAAVAKAWPVPAASPATGEAITAGARESGKSDPDNADSNIQKGRDVAIATLPEAKAGKVPALHASLVQEAIGWKIDVPNTVTGQQLHDNLLKHLNHLADMQAQWPAEAEVAQVVFARHILMGVYGVEMHGEARQASDTGAGAAPAPGAAERPQKQD